MKKKINIKSIFSVFTLVSLIVTGSLSIRPNQVQAATGSLTTNLIGYWSLDEANGTRASSVGTHTLGDNGTAVNGVAGKISNAASFTGANYLFVNADTALKTNNTAFTVSMWVRLTNKTTSYILAAKASEWRILYDQNLDRFRFSVYSGGFEEEVFADTLGSPTAGVWYHIVARQHDSLTQMSITVNAGTPTSDLSRNTENANNAFSIGSDAGSFPSVADVDELGFWTRMLNTGEISALYNSGNALAYSSFAGTDPNPVVPGTGGAAYANISNVKTNTVTDTSAQISWSTDRDSTGVVEYGTGNSFDKSVSTSVLGKTHNVTLSGLKAKTDYTYRIKASTSPTVTTNSFNYNFTTTEEVITPAPTPEPLPPQDLLPAPPIPPTNPPTPPAQVIFPENVKDGEVIKFKGNPTVYLVSLEGLHPFDTFESFKNYITSSKQTLKELAGPASLYTLKQTTASSILQSIKNTFPSNTLVNDRGTLYLIQGDHKIGIATQAALAGLGYSTWKVENGDTSNYKMHAEVLDDPNEKHSFGSWIHYDNKKYYFTENGEVLMVNPESTTVPVFVKEELFVLGNQNDITYITSKIHSIITDNDPRILK